MEPRSLLERIDQGASGGRNSRHNGDEMVESVLDHLRRMLNTRQGHALIAPDYGMPDFTGFSQSPDASRALQTAIWDSIRKYEPRLKKVQVNCLEADQLEIRFQIVATMQADAKNISVTFETAVDPSGRIRVK